jgi:hypothetical protein
MSRAATLPLWSMSLAAEAEREMRKKAFIVASHRVEKLKQNV